MQSAHENWKFIQPFNEVEDYAKVLSPHQMQANVDDELGSLQQKRMGSHFISMH